MAGVIQERKQVPGQFAYGGVTQYTPRVAVSSSPGGAPQASGRCATINCPPQKLSRSALFRRAGRLRPRLDGDKRPWIGRRVWIVDSDGKRRHGTLWWNDGARVQITIDTPASPWFRSWRGVNGGT